MIVGDWLRRFFGQDRAIANARAASTDLARRLVEHEEVRIFLQRQAARGRRSA